MTIRILTRVFMPKIICLGFSVISVCLVGSGCKGYTRLPKLLGIIMHSLLKIIHVRVEPPNIGQYMGQAILSFVRSFFIEV